MEIIRKIIKEVLGIQNNIEKMTFVIMNWTHRNIIFNLDLMNDGIEHNLPIITTISNSKIINDTQIFRIKTNIFFKLTNEEKIGGEFAPKNTIRNKNGMFEIEIKLIIHTNEINSDLIKNNIQSVIAHELNHAFVFIKKYNKQSKSQIYNKVKGMLGAEFKQIPELKEFIQMFYLNLPEEIQARVQETGTLLKKIKAKDSDEAVRELYLYQPINDAKRMTQYTNENIKSLDKKLLQNFINSFNGNVDFAKKGIEIKKITDVDKFFKHWIGEINQNGFQLNMRILKLVSDKFSKRDKLKDKENDKAYLKEFIDSGFMDDILGETFC